MSHEEIRAALSRLASNHAWTWTYTTRRLLNGLPGAEPGKHPAAVVAELSEHELAQLASDDEYGETIRVEIVRLESVTTEPSQPRIAYFSPEFGLAASLPQYAGGLGVLAGDHLKTASDMNLPLAGVGLFYREGVFRQVIPEDEQTEAYHSVDPALVGAVDTGVVVGIPFPGREVSARVWRLDVGRVSLIVLDTDVESNTPEDRRITDRLYSGSRQHRLEQEMVLGVGGARALAAMGWDIDLHHLNEGHAGFVILELVDRIIDALTLEEARIWVRQALVFTTHTPVPAGIDRFDADLIRPFLAIWAERWGVSVDDLWELGADPEDPGSFNMAALCLRSAQKANGVSELHGEVSRKLFAGVGIGDDIEHVTNGVHVRTWTAPHFQDLFDETLGEGWDLGHSDAWGQVVTIDDDTLIEMRRRSSILLADLVAERTGSKLDPDALILGFARRFAPYKRATLLLRRPEALEALLADDARPVHLVFAGKAHPTDAAGKALVAEVVQAAFAQTRVSFIPDYDMDIASALVQGADIWLNNPIRPREASGTSGEKAVLNGSLNCSILDGWWAEMYDGQNGWEVAASTSPDPETRDLEEADSLLTTIRDVATEYHQARPVFLGRIRHAWKTLAPRVASARMLAEYVERFYP